MNTITTPIYKLKQEGNKKNIVAHWEFKLLDKSAPDISWIIFRGISKFVFIYLFIYLFISRFLVLRSRGSEILFCKKHSKLLLPLCSSDCRISASRLQWQCSLNWRISCYYIIYRRCKSERNFLHVAVQEKLQICNKISSMQICNEISSNTFH